MERFYVHNMTLDNLSTYAKGEIFEEQVFQFLNREIDEGRFYFRPENCRVHRKKSYYSHAREGYIIFDIAIEVFLPGLEKPSMLILIECKNYTGTVPVNDIEEFCSKISQVAGFNVKGVFASTSAFQVGTLNIARNKGFGLLRYFDKAEFRWELPRALLSGFRSSSSRKRTEVESALTQPNFQPTIYNAYVVTPAGYTVGWEGIWEGLSFGDFFSRDELRLIYQSPPKVKPRVAFVSRNSIEDLAERVLKSISYTRDAVDLSKIIDIEGRASGLRVSYLEESDSALGCISFSPLEIKIFTSNKGSPLARFTLAHELGHYFLKHERYLARESVQARDIDRSQLILVPKGEVERLEWQANTFASCLLMPRNTFLFALNLLIRHYGIKDRGHGILYLDEQRDNVDNFWRIATSLSEYFGVSLTAIRLRMKALDVLKEA